MHLPIKTITAAIVTMMLLCGVSIAAQTPTPTAPSPAPARSMPKKPHRVVIQVSEADPAVMNIALNNAENLTKFYKDRGETVEIEFVAYGPGLAMMRSDVSPVKARLARMSKDMTNVTFSGCGTTMAKQSTSESKEISLVPEAHIVTAGIGRIVELQELGWAYVRP
jgi:intracellular sulfur oxidation DsrE/DsrF family protein